MRRPLAAVLVAALVLFAGCGAFGGGGGSVTSATPGDSTPADSGGDQPAAASTSSPDPTPTFSGEPTPSPTPTPTLTPTPTPQSESSGSDTDVDAPPGVEDGRMVNHSRFTGALLEQVGEGPVEFRMSFENRTAGGSSSLDYLLRNDTEARLYRLDQSGMGVTTYYVTDGPDGVRNTTTGEIRYGKGDSRIEFEAGFTLFIALLPVQFINSMEWEVTGTDSVDGTEAVVLESDSLNRTAATQFRWGLGDRTENFTSVEGRLLAGPDGLVYTGTVNATGTAEDGSTASLDIAISMTEKGVTVEQPPWFDESETGESE